MGRSSDPDSMSSSSAGRSQEARSSDDKESLSQTNSPPVHLSELGLGREEENLLTVWYLRVRDSMSQNPIVHDEFTTELMNKLSVDLSRSQFRLDSTYVQYAASRTKQIDDWTTDFLDRHQYEDVLVLQLRCGLDNRYLRVNRGKDVKWIDVERPNVVRLRERLLQRPQGDYSLIAGDVGVGDDAWLKNIPSDRPTLIIMESLVYYLEPGSGLRLFQRLLAHFRHGNIAMDTLGSLAVTFGALFHSTRTRFKWGIDDAEDLVKIDDRLVLRERIYTQEVFAKEDKPPWFGGWTPVISLLPKVSGLCAVSCRFTSGMHTRVSYDYTLPSISLWLYLIF